MPKPLTVLPVPGSALFVIINALRFPSFIADVDVFEISGISPLSYIKNLLEIP